MNNFSASYNIILNHLQELKINFEGLTQIRKPKLGNTELISISLTAEFLGIDSELQLFRTIENTELCGKIERSVYNRRRRLLFPYLEKIRVQLAEKMNQNEHIFVIDSMPLEVCKIARAGRSKICKNVDYAYPDKGFCASQQMYYYGFKIHGVCSASGVFHSFDLSPASVHDIHFLKDVKINMSNCTLLGDMGYLSAEYQLNLFETKKIELQTPMRSNQKDYKPQHYIFKKKRKIIETLFSQLCDQFMIRRNYAKSFEGLKTRVLSKITAMTIVQYLNLFVFNRPMNKLKINLS